jgi:hypothetical protein
MLPFSFPLTPRSMLFIVLTRHTTAEIILGDSLLLLFSEAGTKYYCLLK